MAEANDPHEVHEDPEQHLGKEIADPWEDPEQEDWPTGSIDVPEVKN